MTDRFWFESDGEIFASPTWEAPPTIGSSDAAAILGLSPWRGPWDVWPGIVGLVERYRRTSDAAQTRGHRLEPLILQWYSDDYGIDLVPGPSLFGDSELLTRDGWAHDHPDAFEVGLAGCRADCTASKCATTCNDWHPMRHVRAVEAKTLRWFDSQWGSPGTDQVPIHYLTQCAHHRFVTGLPVVLIAYATGSDELRAYDLDLPDRVVDRQAELLKAWHTAHVVEGKPPPLDGSDGCARTLATLYQYGSGSKVYRDATPHEVEIASELAELRAEIKRLSAEASERENALRTSIGSNYGIKCDGKNLAIWFPRTKLDEPAIAIGYPELDLEQYRKPASLDRVKFRKAHADIERRYSVESGRTFRLNAANLPIPTGEGEGW